MKFRLWHIVNALTKTKFKFYYTYLLINKFFNLLYLS